MRLFVYLLAAANLSLLSFTARSSTGEPDDGGKTIGEIVVTGEFRDTPLDRLPASVSVLGARDVQARGAHHLEDLLGLAPNVNIAGGSARSRFFQIRGIGERSQFIEPLNPSVGLIVDGVDISDSALGATLFDVDQVEIFRGPQGTRYGANALAGMINVKTLGPTDIVQANLSAEAANYDTWMLNGAVSGPLSERLSARFAAQQYSSRGFFHNDFLDRDTDERDELSFRGKVRWLPSEETTVNAMFGYVDVNDGYDAFSLDNNRTTLSDEPGRDTQRSAFGSVSFAWNGSDNFAVEADAAAASSDHTYGYDEDWTFVGFDPGEYSSTDYYFRKRHNVSGEIKWLSKEPARLFGGRSDWVLGVYALDRRENLRREYTFLAGPFGSRFDVERRAAFGELKTALDSRTNLITGARYEHHKAAYSDSEAVAFSPQEDLIGWRVSVDRELREALMAYVSISRGYKAGGFNTDGTLDADLREYDAETLLNYEVGLKVRLLDERLTAQLTAFHMQRKDVQIATSITRPRPDGSSEFVDFIGNAAKGTNLGIEAEVTYLPTDRLEILASLGLLKSKYKSFVNELGDSLDGREQAHAPGYQFAARARYAFTPNWYTEAGVEGRDAFYYSDSHDTRSRAYQLFNATLGYTRGAWETTLWVRNLTDEDYHTRGYFFGNDPRIDYEARDYTQLGDPRQFGVTASWSFR